MIFEIVQATGKLKLPNLFHKSGITLIPKPNKMLKINFIQAYRHENINRIKH